jgi:hypothetical protein
VIDLLSHKSSAGCVLVVVVVRNARAFLFLRFLREQHTTNFSLKNIFILIKTQGGHQKIRSTMPTGKNHHSNWNKQAYTKQDAIEAARQIRSGHGGGTNESRVDAYYDHDARGAGGLARWKSMKPTILG